MSPKQKLVLAVLGALDLVIILGLGAVVVRSQLAPAPLTAVITPDPCAQALLNALDDVGRDVAVDWGTGTARVTLTIRTPEPELPSGQHLWRVLDAFPAPLPATCPTPRSVTLSVQVPDGGAHTAELDGRDLGAWLAGTLSDAELAARTRYRARP